MQIEIIDGNEYWTERYPDGRFEQYLKSPEPPPRIPTVEFWERFTEAEQEAVVDSANKKVKAFLYRLRIMPAVYLSDPKTIRAVNALETAGLIGAGRAAEILA